jgi:hypothetical protein
MHAFILRHLKLNDLRLGLWILSIPALLSPLVAQAVPTFNRQTGQNCVACHAGGVFPELTPYGRMFKLTGYTIGERTIPLSGMAVGSYTKTKDTTSDDPTSDFPKDGIPIFQTASLFLAGKITDNIGGFVQWTFNTFDTVPADAPDGRFHSHSGSDNLDVRYADRFVDPTKDLIFGVVTNNNPTVQDVFNSVPAWGFNVVPGSSGPDTPPNAPPLPQLSGGLAQLVAGAGAYAYWNKMVYAELSAYKTANGVFSFMSQGTNNTDQTKVKGANPYWRLALTHEWGPHNVMIGTSGMIAKIFPNNEDPSGPTSKFRDIGFDAQYQYLLDPHTVTAQIAYIREKQTLADALANQAGAVDAANGTDPGTTQAPTNSSNTLNLFRAKATYVYQAKYGGSLSFFNLTGSTDTALQTSVVQDSVPIDGSTRLGNASGDPATRGWTAEAFWTPIQYARVGLQYTWYDKFNGASNNYDGFGRNAKDNNTLFLYIWGAY